MRSALTFFAVVGTTVLLACGGGESGSSSDATTNPGTVSWEPGEYSFDVTLEPWPASAGGTVTVRAVASADDSDQSYSGSVSCRVQPEGGGPGEWLPMSATSLDGGDTQFECDVMLPGGSTGIHFKLDDRRAGRVVELTDWTVRVGS